MKRSRKNLEGLIVLVTGASSGIGEATAREFARWGSKVVVTARRVDRLERLADEIRREGGTALPVPADLTSYEQIKQLVTTVLEQYGRIDVLANIAGWGHYDWFEEQTAESLRNQYEVNVLGLAELTRQVLPAMKAQRSGHIINMSSYASRISVPPLTVYASTKYAVEGLTDGLRRELIPWGIKVTRIHPSAVTGTEYNRKASADGGITYRSLPIGRVSREQIGREIVDLVRSPQRAVFRSRLYEPAVILNRLAPGLLDSFFGLWVRQKRKAELADLPSKPARYRGSRLAWASGLIALTGALALRAFIAQAGHKKPLSKKRLPFG